MPIYEFRCDRCGYEAEVIQKYNDVAPQCPNCQVALKRQLSAGSFRLLGEGWHAPTRGVD